MAPDVLQICKLLLSLTKHLEFAFVKLALQKHLFYDLCIQGVNVNFEGVFSLLESV